VPGCSKVAQRDIEDWMVADDEFDMTDNDIVELVKGKETQD
jgi:hypothetical protein